MTTPAAPSSTSVVKQALRALDQMRGKLDALERARREPIAIVSMACRYAAGCATPEALWEFLAAGGDAVTEVPKQRWDVDRYYHRDPTVLGKSPVRWASFLEQVDQFDPLFFGISPREAVSMDPQQRLLLEVTHEAFERMGLAPQRLANSRTGVFVGICNNDYLQYLVRDPLSSDTYSTPGISASVAAGRISYMWDLRGPCVPVDTACSSSGVAIHLACQSLRAGECDMALASGVNLLLSPLTFVLMTPVGVLSPDGRSRTFDARANGYVRGEGCGVLVLKRLSDALKHGDPIEAVIHGSAVNHDGRSNGLSAPSLLAQREAIELALASGGIKHSDVEYVEAHGTATPLGDPIEMEALKDTYGRPRAGGGRCLVGAVKTNFGHLEGAAGVLGLMKVVMCLKNRRVPPNLHFQKLNPRISLDGSTLGIPTQLMPWPSTDGSPAVAGRRRYGAVSSFGFGGTNVHMVVGEAPAPAARVASSAKPVQVVALSARSPTALSAVVGSLRARLGERPELELGDVALTANVGRTHHAHRFAPTASSLDELAAKLSGRAAKANDAAADVQRLLCASDGVAPKVAFLFSGQGSQYAGMAARLTQTDGVFRETIERCAEVLQGEIDRPLMELLGAEDPALLRETVYAQPLLFALEYALAELWRSWGIEPAAVMGHSLGEYVAATVAGVFSLEDGLKLVARRARLMHELPRDGGMAAIFAEPSLVSAALAPFSEAVSIAAINGPTEVVISGRSEELGALLDRFGRDNVRFRRLDVSHAFHSPLVEPIRAALTQEIKSIARGRATIPLISNLTGECIDDALLDAGYWVRHLREPVQFAAGLASLRSLGCSLFVELGPGAQLAGLGARCLPPAEALWVPSLRKDRDDWRQLAESLAQLYENGAEVDWPQFHADEGARIQSLPTYPFERKRYWTPAVGDPVASVGAAPPSREAGLQSTHPRHPLLERRIQVSGQKGTVFETTLRLEDLPYLADHRVFGDVVCPAALYLEMAREAAERTLAGEGAVSLQEVVFERPLNIVEQAAVRVQLVLTFAPETARRAATFHIASLQHDRGDHGVEAEEDVWIQHVAGKLQRGAEANDSSESAADLRARCNDAFPIESFYAEVARLGITLGPQFQSVKRAWTASGEAFGEIRVSCEPNDRYTLHPALLDGCFQVAAIAAMKALGSSEQPRLPFWLESLRITGTTGSAALCSGRVRSSSADGRELVVDVVLHDENGKYIAEARGLHCRTPSESILRGASSQLHAEQASWLYEVAWRQRKRSEFDGRAARASLLSPSAIVEKLRGAPADGPSLAHYKGFRAQLDRLVAGYVAQALQRLGWEELVGVRASAPALAERLGVGPSYQRLFARLLEILREDGGVVALDEIWGPMPLAALASASSHQAVLLEQYPACESELMLIGRCGDALSDILTGKQNPLEVLFPGGSLGLLERMYSDSPFILSSQLAVSRAVAAALSTAQHAGANGRPVRIVEIGAGTGSTTQHVLRALSTANVAVDYVFSDVSPIFLAAARDKFAAHRFVRFETLDIERPPDTQGFQAHGFDLVLAANVLHATTDLRRTLRHVRQLLAPGGDLVVLEGVRRERAGDLTLGLTDGWWKFQDLDLRPVHPLLSCERWLSLLAEGGFSEARALDEAIDESDAVSAQAVLLAREPLNELTRPWLVIGDRGGRAERLVAALAERGVPAVCVRDDCQRALREGSEAGWAAIVHLAALDQVHADSGPDLNQLRDAQGQVLGGVLSLVQALAAQPPLGAPKLWIVTAGAQPILGPSSGSEPALLQTIAQTPVWGMGRVIAQEHSELWGGLIDLDPADLDDGIDRLIIEVSEPDGEDQIALRERRRYIARLRSKIEPAASQGQFALDAGASYLVVGGFGGLGLEVAAFLAQRGARHLALLGRSQPSAQAEKRFVELRSQGVELLTLEADVADRPQMVAALARIRREMPALRGLFHCAGSLADATIVRQSWARFQQPLAAKIDGSWILHELTASDSLDLFVLFSSAATLLGSPGQANHSAANAFEDALAHARQQIGRRALSINWAAWSGVGAAATRSMSERMGMVGLEPISPRVGVAILRQLLLDPETAQTAVLPIRWGDWRRSQVVARAPRLLADVIEERSHADQKIPAVGVFSQDIRQRLGSTDDEWLRHAALTEYLTAQVARVLRIETGQLSPQISLAKLGMDSLMAIQIKNRIEVDLEVVVPVVVFLEGPSVAALSTLLLKRCDRRNQAENALIAPPTSGELAEDPVELLARIDQLSDAEVNRLFHQMNEER